MALLALLSIEDRDECIAELLKAGYEVWGDGTNEPSAIMVGDELKRGIIRFTRGLRSGTALMPNTVSGDIDSADSKC